MSTDGPGGVSGLEPFDLPDGRLDTGVLLLAKPYRKSEMAAMIRTALAG